MKRFLTSALFMVSMLAVMLSCTGCFKLSEAVIQFGLLDRKSVERKFDGLFFHEDEYFVLAKTYDKRIIYV